LKANQNDVLNFITRMNRATKHGGAFDAEYRIIADDRARWVRAQGNFTVDSSGRPFRAMGLGHRHLGSVN
jgi:hypothetical protein